MRISNGFDIREHSEQLNKALKLTSPDLDKNQLLKTLEDQYIKNDDWNKEQWDNNRPSSYETWQLIAKVISYGDANYYQPTLAANNHWKNWEESGSF